MSGMSMKLKPIIGVVPDKIIEFIKTNNGDFVYDSEDRISLDWLTEQIKQYAPQTVFLGFEEWYSSASCDCTYTNFIINKDGYCEFFKDDSPLGISPVLDKYLIIRGFEEDHPF